MPQAAAQSMRPGVVLHQDFTRQGVVSRGETAFCVVGIGDTSAAAEIGLEIEAVEAVVAVGDRLEATVRHACQVSGRVVAEQLGGQVGGGSLRRVSERVDGVLGQVAVLIPHPVEAAHGKAFPPPGKIGRKVGEM